MILSHQSIAERCQGDRPLISPFKPGKLVVNGKSSGNSSASYDCCIDHDLVLGVNPAFIIRDHILEHGFFQDWMLQDALNANPPMQALAYTEEDFCMPADLSGAVADKSSYARVFVSAFNTFFDPGFHGNATLELVNLGDKPVTFKKGDPVVQFIFSMLDQPTVVPYAGKYQHQTKAAHGARHEHADGTFSPVGVQLPAPVAPAAAPATDAVADALADNIALAVRNGRQVAMAAWVDGIWGTMALHPHERVERLYEENCELAQAEGVVGGLAYPALKALVASCDGGGPFDANAFRNAMLDAQKALATDRLAQIAAQVYRKSAGMPAQEVGGISTCLLAYCVAKGISADECEQAELARILALSPEHFRERHAAKVASGMALPLAQFEGTAAA